MMEIRKINIQPSTKVYNQYKDMNIPMVNPFKEFIDNSSQSYFDHEEKLKLVNGFQKLVIKINIKSDKIVIIDNAYGMNYADFERSLKLSEPKDTYSINSRSQYGVGLKYASMYLGDYVTIESTELGSDEKYTASLDSDQLDKNINNVDCKVENVSSEEHYTIITIKKLRHTLTEKDLIDLVKKLGKIYHVDIENGDMEIVFNGNINVKHVPPKIKIDPETGSELINYFDGEIEFKNKIFKYNGWAAILDTAVVSDAGFSLLQSNRLIVMNYRPSKLFGQANSFKYQRVIGEINLDGWPVVNNKLNFKWDDGLEELFINHLKNNKRVSEVMTTATNIRQRNIETDEKRIKKNTPEIEKIFEPLSHVKKTIVEEVTKDENAIKAYISGITGIQKLNIEFESTKYIFNIAFADEEEFDRPSWLTVEIKDQSKNEYLLLLNRKYDPFRFVKNDNEKAKVTQYVTAILAIAQLSSVKSGLKDAHKFIGKINEIVGYTGLSDE